MARKTTGKIRVIEKARTAERERFEEEAFPHLEALWRTSLWLTMRSNYAEELVLRTMTEAYRTWHVSVDNVGSKARLFRCLTRAFYDTSSPRPHRGRPPQQHSGAGTNTGRESEHCPETSIDHQELLSLSRISHVFVKGATACLQTQSRLIIILLLRERFSYSEIAYITDLREVSVVSILNRLRRRIPRYLVQHTDRFVAAAENRTGSRTVAVRAGDKKRLSPLPMPGLTAAEVMADAASSWDNEGGAVHGCGSG